MFGMMFEKVGMTSVFNEDEKMKAVTVLRALELRILGVSNAKKQGYAALRVAYGTNRKEKKKAILGIYKDLAPARGIAEFRLTDEEAALAASFPRGAKISINSLKDVARVDARARSVGKGFQGVIKRYGMSGGPASHGSHFHRAPGSIGMCADPARVFKGRHLPGQMGFVNVCVQSLPVFSIDEKEGILLLEGSVPGRNGALVRITPAVKLRLSMKIEVEDGEEKEQPVPTPAEVVAEGAGEAVAGE